MNPASESAESSFAELYEEAPCGYLTLAPSGEIRRVNRTFLSWTGYSADELQTDRHFAQLLTVPSALMYESLCAPLLRLRGSVGEIALDILCRDGKSLPVLFSAEAKKDPSGTLTMFRVVVLNAPTRREYERELLRARRQADEAAEMLRTERAITERKVADQDILLQAVSRLAAGDLSAAIPMNEGSSLDPLARGLERMRQDILRQIGELKERNAEVQQLNRELRHQIERRSGLMVESMLSRIDDDLAELLPVLSPGTLLAGRYRIGEILGQGAMGVVYAVERISDGRRLAAKVLAVKPDYQAMARFAREAQLLARLQHPNLIAIVDADVTPERVAYIIMELESGKSLSDYYERYGDCDFMLPVLYQVADALSTVHAAGVVHRDLKPGNVLISVPADNSQTHAKLVDFGVSRLLDSPPTKLDADSSIPGPAAQLLVAARHGALAPTLAHPLRQPTDVTTPGRLSGTAANPLRDELTRGRAGALPLSVMPLSPAAPAPPATGRRQRSSDELTQAGMILGTLLYMAPELRVGANLANPSADIFSFGVMAYEVLTGTLPFGDIALMLFPSNAALPSFKPLDSLCPGLPPNLTRTIEACLAVDPAGRPTAAELVVALRATALADGVGTPAISL